MNTSLEAADPSQPRPRRRLQAVHPGDPPPIISSQPLVVTPGRTLIDIWPDLTPRKRTRWLREVLEPERARVIEAADRARRQAAMPPLDVPRLMARLEARRAAEADQEDDQMGQPISQRIARVERLRALDRLDEAGAAWDDAKAWAIASGRWLESELGEVNVDAVDAYLSEHPDGPTGAQFDNLLASTDFWRRVVDQCATYAPQAPPEWASALRQLAAGAQALLDLVAAEDPQ